MAGGEGGGRWSGRGGTHDTCTVLDVHARKWGNRGRLFPHKQVSGPLYIPRSDAVTRQNRERMGF